MLARSDTIAMAAAPLVAQLLHRINQICGATVLQAHTIGAYQIGLYVYPEPIEINVSHRLPLPASAVVSLIAHSLQSLITGVGRLLHNSSTSGPPVMLEFTSGTYHFRLFCGNGALLRLGIHTKDIIRLSPLCRFAATCLRHLVVIYSLAAGLPKDILCPHTVGTLAIVHHSVFLSTPGPPIFDTRGYMQSVVAFVTGMKSNRVYTSTPSGCAIVDQPPLSADPLQLDNPCLLHPLCHTIDLLRGALYFRAFQRWLSVGAVVWLCRQP